MPKVSKDQIVPVTGEHIFHANYLEPLALKWKELNAEGKHAEAMAVLEEIVIGSTQMFERLAQHECYHYTVDLPILVSAAQEKVVKWLLKWEKKKGRLFSWFSKSYAGYTHVLLADGTTKRIDEIVENKLSVDVISWNRSTGQFEPKPVVDWFKTKVEDMSTWRRLWFKLPDGNHPGNQRDNARKRVTLTNDHEVYTDRGIVRVDELKPTDSLCIARPNITPDGMSALIGMYLGDGTITKKGHFTVAHGTHQHGYTEHIAEKFGGRKVCYSKVKVTWKQVATGNMLTKVYPTASTRIIHKRLWKNCPLEKDKVISEWLLDNINPVVMAYWYMDDGYLGRAPKNPDRRIPILCCECFSLQDQQRIAERLLAEWGLAVSPQKYKGKYRLAVLDGSVARFFGYIAPYLLPMFDYKIPTEHRSIPKKVVEFIRHDVVYCTEFKVTPVSRGHRWSLDGMGSEAKKLEYKYDITVADNHNIVVMQNGKTQNGIASGLCACQCAKNAFRTELVKVNQFRKRYHVTGDNLEKFFGSEDHEVDKTELASEVRASLANLTCRWGCPQEIGTIHYLIECILEEEEHDKQAAIRGAAYAWGISFDLSKFFYGWSLSALRDQMYKKIRVPYSEEDIILTSLSYSRFVDLFTMPNSPFTWKVHGKYLVSVFGGSRLPIPSITQIGNIIEDQKIYNEIEAGDKDPDSVAEVGAKHGKNARTAQDTYIDMVACQDPRRLGEYEIYGDDYNTISH
jgi:hypothetical protein